VRKRIDRPIEGRRRRGQGRKQAMEDKMTWI